MPFPNTVFECKLFLNQYTTIFQYSHPTIMDACHFWHIHCLKTNTINTSACANHLHTLKFCVCLRESLSFILPQITPTFQIVCMLPFRFMHTVIGKLSAEKFYLYAKFKLQELCIINLEISNGVLLQLFTVKCVYNNIISYAGKRR